MDGKTQLLWSLVEDLVNGILTTVAHKRSLFASLARKQGITLERLTAAAIAGALYDNLEARRRNPAPGRTRLGESGTRRQVPIHRRSPCSNSESEEPPRKPRKPRRSA
jgi:hypothetical protein